MKLKEQLKLVKNKFYPLVKTWDCYNDEPRMDKLVNQDVKECVKIADAWADEKCLALMDWLDNHRYTTPNVVDVDGLEPEQLLKLFKKEINE